MQDHEHKLRNTNDKNVNWCSAFKTPQMFHLKVKRFRYKWKLYVQDKRVVKAITNNELINRKDVYHQIH